MRTTLIHGIAAKAAQGVDGTKPSYYPWLETSSLKLPEAPSKQTQDGMRQFVAAQPRSKVGASCYSLTIILKPSL